MTGALGTIVEIAERVASGEQSAEEVARQSLGAIERGAHLNAFLHSDAERVIARAREIDAQRTAGATLGKLCGVPIAIKDAICTADAPTTAGSKILTRSSGAGWRPPYDATVITRLREAGAVLVGKTNMDEFAMGSSNENSAFGPVKNPWDETRIPGGSSGGSAVAVAAEMAAGALGSDTGGSIRQPAALTGVVGVKPTYGRVSRFGLVAFASSLDQIGPMARDVRSAARLLEVIAGHDRRDSTSSTHPVGKYEAACDRDPKGLVIGVPDEYFAQGLDRDVEQSVRSALSALEGAGVTLRPISLPHTRYGVATYYVIATAEASANLARFDGVRFGLRVEPSGADLKTLYEQTRDAGFGAEVKRRILLGTYVLSAGYYDAYYKKATEVRALIRADFDRALSEVDAIATPTSPVVAFELGERSSDPLSMYMADVCTLPASLAGISALSVPAAPSPKTPTRPALPVGLQLIGPAFGEERLFTLAAAWERLRP